MAARQHQRRTFTTCPNCGTDLQPQWHFCPGCGQENEERVIPFRVLVKDFFSDFLTFDSRFFRTIPPFLFKPGVVTRDYLQGKRVRYVAPMRILLFGCLLLFAVAGRYYSQYDWEDNINFGNSGLALEINAGDSVSVETDSGTIATTFGQLKDTLASPDKPGNPGRESVQGFMEGARGSSEPARPQNPDKTATAQEDSLLQVLEQEADMLENQADSIAAMAGADTSGSGDSRNLFNWMNKIGEQIPALADSMSAQAVADSLAPDAGYVQHRVVVQMAKVYKSKGQGMVGFAVSNGTVSVFLAVLLMALFMKLLYWRPQRRYVEHVVFSVHGHAALVYLTLVLLLIKTFTGQFYQQAYILLMPYYTLGLRRVYDQGWIRSILKMLVIGSFYTIVLLPFLTLLALALSFLFF